MSTRIMSKPPTDQQPNPKAARSLMDAHLSQLARWQQGGNNTSNNTSRMTVKTATQPSSSNEVNNVKSTRVQVEKPTGKTELKAKRSLLDAHLKHLAKRLQENKTTNVVRSRTIVDDVFNQPAHKTPVPNKSESKTTIAKDLKQGQNHDVAKSWRVKQVFTHAFAKELENIDYEEDGKTLKSDFLSAKTGDLESYLDVAWTNLQPRLKKRGPFKGTAFAELVWYNDNQNALSIILHPKDNQNIHATRCMSENGQLNWWQDTTKALMQDIEDFEGRGSGWRLVRVNNIQIKTYDAHLITAGLDIETPALLAQHHSVVNVRWTGQECGRYTMLAYHWHKTVRSVICDLESRSQHKEVYEVLRKHNLLGKKCISEAATYELLARELGDPFDWNGIQFPMDAHRDWKRFEKNNPGYSIRCFWYHERGECEETKSVIDPLYVPFITPEQREQKKIVYILMLGDRNSEPGDDDNHYVWWKNPGSTLNAMGLRYNHHTQKICDICVHPVDARSFDNHMKMHADNHCAGRVVLPSGEGGGNVVSFGNRPFCHDTKYKYQLPTVFAAYCDFECDNRECSGPQNGKTEKLFKHVPNSWAMTVTQWCDDRKGTLVHDACRICEPNSTSDCVKELGRHCHEVAERLYGQWIGGLKPLDETTVPDNYATCTECHICKNKQHIGFLEFTSRSKKLLIQYLKTMRKEQMVNEVKCGDLTNVHKVNYFSKKSKDDFIIKTKGEAKVMFQQLKWRKVRDHDHETGHYRGAAHSQCNVQYTQKGFKFVIMFHNWKGYDQHALLKHIKRYDKHDRITALCINQEKFHSVSWSRGDVKSPTLQFQDSMSFLQASLDSVVGELRDAPGGPWENLPRTRIFVQNYLIDRFGSESVSNERIREALTMVSGKAPYPYEWSSPDRWSCMDIFDGDLKDCKMYKLLKHNKLNGVQNPEDIRLEQLQQKNEENWLKDTIHAKKVWDAFGMRTFMDYHNLYLQLDVHHLADAMENFRTNAMADEDIGLDPLWFMGVPGLTYNAALRYVERKLPDIKLETITDPDMLALVLATKRGGICQVNKRHVIANNKYMKRDFNPNESSKYIEYLDMTNLYGAAMCEALPTGNYLWVDPDDVDKIIGHDRESVLAFLKQYEDDGPKGFIFQVKRLFLPSHLHDKFADYPLAPETKHAPGEVELSPFQKAIKPPSENASRKLILDLKEKTNYACHWRNLKFMLEQGYEIDGIEKVLSFDQAPWLRNYVNAMTEKRKKAAQIGNQRLVALYKLMINSLYGKLCENVLGRSDIKVTFRDDTFAKYTKMPSFKADLEINDELICALMAKSEVKVNTLMAAGMAVLDLSKLQMQKFYYKVMMDKFGATSEVGKPSINLVYTDTDSLVYEITYDDAGKAVKGDVYADMHKLKDHFDMSVFKDSLPMFYNATNCKVVGKMKSESNGLIILEFIAIRPKAYAFCVQEEEFGETEHKKAKGVKKMVVKKEMFMSDYRKVLNASVELFMNGENLRDLISQDKSLGQEALRNMQYRRNQCQIQSKRHELGLHMQRDRVVLSAYDNKRYWLNDGISSLPYGHYRTNIV